MIPIEQKSKWKIYSLGIAAENKPLTTNDLEVTPLEVIPQTDGEVSEKVDDYAGAAEGSKGNGFDVVVPHGVAIKAKWLDRSGGNRATAPDIRRGEPVFIYQYSDHDGFWWEPRPDGSKTKRRLETVVHHFSNSPIEDEALNSDNTYFFEVSTHRKVVHFKTSNSDGEPFIYDINIDTKTGVLTITDDVGNCFQINSADSSVFITNKDKSTVEVIGLDVNVSCDGKITAEAPEIVATCTTAEITASGSVTVTSPTINLVGNVNITGDLNVSGAVKNDDVDIGKAHMHTDVVKGTEDSGEVKK